LLLDYIQTLLSAPSDAKHFLAVKGYVPEGSGNSLNVNGSSSYLLRTSYFREDRATDGKFRDGGATFAGRLSKIKT